MHFVLCAIRDGKLKTPGFSPAELVFGHNVRGLIKVIKEQFSSETSVRTNVLDFGSKCGECLHQATALARETLSSPQYTMKQRFDLKAKERHFRPGDEVLVLLPSPGFAVTACSLGPYVVKDSVSATHYVNATPDRRRKTSVILKGPSHEKSTF